MALCWMASENDAGSYTCYTLVAYNLPYQNTLFDKLFQI